MVTIRVDGKDYTVDESKNLLDTLLGLGLDVPYFCWHPSMGSVGSCRQCAVKVYAHADDEKGRILMSCMTPITEGMQVSIMDQKTEEFRRKSIEVTMANHPHDCPVCEEGGECHLQDMTIMSGHSHRHYTGKKKTYTNQYLGPCINHEMNRCITCYRCVRFYDDYAGGKDLAAMSSRENVYFGRQQPGILESPFSGNLVEVCPTGVFTDKTLAQSYTRKWDLQTAPSICSHCSLGCNTSPGERYGKIKRVVNRYHEDINRYFICDRGRFGYAHTNRAERYQAFSIRQSENRQTCSEEDAFSLVKKWMSEVHSEQSKLLAVGSPSASIEENFALQTLVGVENFYSGLDVTSHQVLLEILKIQQSSDIHTPTLREIEQADAVLILGEDLIHSAPMMGLSVRQSTRHVSYELAKQAHIPLWQDASVRTIGQQQRSPLMIASVANTDLDEIASHCYNATPDDIASMGFAIAHRLNDQAPNVDKLSPEQQDWVDQVATCLQQASRPVIISGSSLNSVSVIHAAAQIAKALTDKTEQRKGHLALVTDYSNSLGLAMLLSSTGDEASSQHLSAAIDRVIEDEVPYKLIVLQNDLYQKEEQARVDALLEKCKRVIVIEQQPNRVSQHADLVIPATTIFETEGTLVNYEGRAQRYFSVFNQTNPALKDNWRHLVWLAKASIQANLQDNINNDAKALSECSRFDDIVHLFENAQATREIHFFSEWEKVAHDANFRIANMKIPRQSPRYSGRTSMNASLSVSEEQQPIDTDSALAYSMEGVPWQYPNPLSVTAWAPGWNSNEAENKYQKEINGASLSGNKGVLLKRKESGADANHAFDWFQPSPNGEYNHPPEDNKLLAVMARRVFDGDSLSALSPALLERAGIPNIQLNPVDLPRLGIDEKKPVHVHLQDRVEQFYVNPNLNVAEGVAIIPSDPKTKSNLSLSLLPAWIILEPNHE
jgi:NADH-quinone oxidoreductase subunit G